MSQSHRSAESPLTTVVTTSKHPRILLVHAGGLGDLVLVSELTAGLKRALPGCRLTVLCRAEMAPVMELHPVPPDEIIPVPVNPNGWPAAPGDSFDALDPVTKRLRELKADVLVEGSLQPTWLSEFAAAIVKPETALSCTLPAEPAPQGSGALEHFGLSPWPFERIALPPEIHERQRYTLLLNGLGVSGASAFPWKLPERWRSAAHDRLHQLGLREQSYLVCFPCGAPSTRIKRWPEDHFAAVLGRVQSKWQLPTLLIGENSEREELNRLAEAVPESGECAQVFSGAPNDIPLAAGLLSMAKLYLGNDTGPMHLAAAYNVPGVSLYGGGGQWPRYAPWANGSVGLLHPLPCFGCSWDCFLGRALCVESIPVERVNQALDRLLTRPSGAAETRTLQIVKEPLLRIISEASAQYRASQRDRAERLEVIHQLTIAIRERDGRIAEVSHAAAERLQTLESTHREAALRERGMHALTAAIAERDARITELEQALGLQRQGARSEE